MSWKSGHSKGGCVNLILQISSKCGQRGGRGSKNPKILRMSLLEAPLLGDLKAAKRLQKFIPKEDEEQTHQNILSVDRTERLISGG